MSRSHTPSSAGPSRARRVGLAVALWLFGLFTTVLLIGMWGRSVTTSERTIEDGTRAVLESDTVSDRITAWIADGIETSAGELPDGVATDAAGAVWRRPETQGVLATAVDRLVEAALAPPGNDVPIDLSELLRPVAPVVVGELGERGISVSSEAVAAALEAAPTIMLTTEGERGFSSMVADARALLTNVVAVGLAGMVVSAIVVIFLAEERLRQLRSLALRVVVSALTFAILLRIGAWALDPRGGRSPLAAGGAVVLASSGHVLVFAAVIAAVIATVATIGVKRRRRGIAF